MDFDFDFAHHHQQVLNAIAASEKRIMSALDDIAQRLTNDLPLLVKGVNDVKATLAAQLANNQPPSQATIDALGAVASGIEQASADLEAAAQPPAPPAPATTQAPSTGS